MTKKGAPSTAALLAVLRKGNRMLDPARGNASERTAAATLLARISEQSPIVAKTEVLRFARPLELEDRSGFFDAIFMVWESSIDALTEGHEDDEVYTLRQAAGEALPALALSAGAILLGPQRYKQLEFGSLTFAISKEKEKREGKEDAAEEDAITFDEEMQLDAAMRTWVVEQPDRGFNVRAFLSNPEAGLAVLLGIESVLPNSALIPFVDVPDVAREHAFSNAINQVLYRRVSTAEWKMLRSGQALHLLFSLWTPELRVSLSRNTQRSSWHSSCQKKRALSQAFSGRARRTSATMFRRSSCWANCRCRSKVGVQPTNRRCGNREYRLFGRVSLARSKNVCTLKDKKSSRSCMSKNRRSRRGCVRSTSTPPQP